jgi:hypothetical protein
MSRLFVLLCIFLTGIPAVALEKVSVQGLEERLSGWHKDSDKRIAARLSNFAVTERLSTARLERMSAGLPGDRSRAALLAIADASAFLAPPLAEGPSEPVPETKAQGEILTLAVRYVGEETERLPNFIATRRTTRFQDTKSVPFANVPEYFTPGVFHLLDRNSAQVRYVGWMEA